MYVCVCEYVHGKGTLRSIYGKEKVILDKGRKIKYTQHISNSNNIYKIENDQIKMLSVREQAFYPVHRKTIERLTAKEEETVWKYCYGGDGGWVYTPYSITVGWLQQSSLMTDSIAYSAFFSPTSKLCREKRRENR